MSFTHQIEELPSENTMVFEPRSKSIALRSYGGFKSDLYIHVNVDLDFDKPVLENMFSRVMSGFPKTGHIL